jgi:hypothetical protein
MNVATSDQWNIRTSGSHTLISFGARKGLEVFIVDSLV